jgi:flavin reductase (DIM6/NTAB) family NADH-FMN oxidoreductase RutF
MKIHAIATMTPPRRAQPPSFSPQEFRSALGMFATGVTIVTARRRRPAGRPDGQLLQLGVAGAAAGAVEPGARGGSLSVFSAGSHYAINILAADQKPLAERFALKGATAGTAWPFDIGAGGAPLLHGAAATFECFNRSRYEEGDHVIFVGEVERCLHRAGATPLLFHGGRYYTELPL